MSESDEHVQQYYLGRVTEIKDDLLAIQYEMAAWKQILGDELVAPVEIWGCAQTHINVAESLMDITNWGEESVVSSLCALEKASKDLRAQIADDAHGWVRHRYPLAETEEDSDPRNY
ncbi:hypothetical protein GQX73_g1968 [Xylaria multiplex]|uniref:Uncharacterized protein n=1 Tax=Xylaria multiplex TaxID=323545 RepID=A0A7C8MYE6_9PEZI|nr:hypothetical protein GQX73_g1968 [Xylaria multiplex]